MKKFIAIFTAFLTGGAIIAAINILPQLADARLSVN